MYICVYAHIYIWHRCGNGGALRSLQKMSAEPAPDAGLKILFAICYPGTHALSNASAPARGMCTRQRGRARRTPDTAPEQPIPASKVW